MDKRDAAVSFLNALGVRWWAQVLRGIAAIAFGVLAIAMPRDSLVVLVYLFGVYAIVDGVFNLTVAAQRGSMGARWGWWVVEGLASIAAGIIAFAWPGITAVALLYVIAFWAIITGGTEIGATSALHGGDAWLLGLGGVLSIVFGVLLLARPGVGALTVVWLIGFYAICFGAVLIALGVRLHRLRPSTEHPAPTTGSPTFA